jgi:PleD family two-component response regulator
MSERTMPRANPARLEGMQSPARSPARSPRVPARRTRPRVKRILLICAHPQRSVQVQIELLRHGLMVEIACTIRRGFSVVQHRPPDAIVIDDAIRDQGDTSFCDMIRTAARAAHVPVISLPRYDKGAETPWAIELGAPLPRPLEQPSEHPLVDALRREGIL